MNKSKLKKEIERIEGLLENKNSKFIETELRMYLKMLKRQLKNKDD